MIAQRAWVLCGAGCALLALALSVNASSDPDLGFHVATGRYVLASHAIPSVNVLSYAEPTHPWIAHQWLPATLFAIAFDGAGFAGTLGIRMTLVAITACMLVLAARRLGASPGWTALVIALGTWAAALRFVERPLLFSNLALAVVIFAAAGAWRDRDDPHRAARHVVIAGLATSLAIHLHAGAIFSVLALLAIAAGRAPARDALAWIGAAALAVALAAVVLALYHPYGVRALGVPFQMESDAYLQEHLVEFRSPFAQPLRLLAPYWAFVVLTLGVVATTVRRAPRPWLLVLGLGVLVSMRHARFVDLAWITASPVVAALATQRFVIAPRRLALAASLLALVALGDRTSLAPIAVGGAPAYWPEHLFDAVERERIVGPGFVQDAWAGPALARSYPPERVFFHDAFEAYSPEHYRLYQRIRYGEAGWAAALDRFHVVYVMMRYTWPGERAMQHGAPNLRQRLAADPRWALVAMDDEGEVFARRDGPNAHACARMPSNVDPDRLSFSGPLASARAPLEALRERGRSDRLDALLAMARAAAGDREGAGSLVSGIEDAQIASLARAALDRVHAP